MEWGWPVLWKEMEVKIDETEKRLMVGERGRQMRMQRIYLT